MHVQPSIHVEWVDNEAVALDSATGQLHYLNSPAALVFALILEHGYERALSELRVMHAGEPQLEEHLSELLEDMVEKGLLTDE